MSDQELIQSLTSEIREMRVDLIKLRNIVENQIIESKWMTLQEVCKYLRIGKTCMHERLSSGEFPWAVKRGKNWLFPGDKIKQYAANQI